MVQEITKYIPQRPPFVMIGELVAASATGAITRTHIDPENRMVKDGYFTESGLIENMAQTAAAQAGFIAAENNTEVPVGFIASVKDFRSYMRVAAGTDITTEIQIKDHVLNVTLALGTVFNDQLKVCECEIRIFINEAAK